MGQVWLRGIRGQGRSQADQGIQDVLPQCAQGLWVSQASSTSSGLLASWENFLQYFFFLISIHASAWRSGDILAVWNRNNGLCHMPEVKR